MEKDDHTGANVVESACAKKKSYRKPQILSCEALEVIAATCDPGKSTFDIGIIPDCSANTNS